MSNDKKDVKPEAPVGGITLTADLIKMITEGIKTGVSETILAMKVAEMQEKLANAPYRPPQESCSHCRQPQRACGCKCSSAKCEKDCTAHKKLAVYPESRKYGRWFQGCILNGVRYLSNSLAHKITVPASANFEHWIQVWEENEEQVMNGRVAEHDSGGIGVGASFTPASAGWR
jgi:hypothetical protein